MSRPQTSVNNAFDFTSTITPQQVLSTHSPVCIYCNSNETRALMQDGSFRQCLKCRKNFKATIKPQQEIQNLSQPVSYQKPIFATMRPNYINPFDKN
jgi:tRNA(Ile2) C34 agmatinyltransferase TiaS